jgi:hypothetical protein
MVAGGVRDDVWNGSLVIVAGFQRPVLMIQAFRYLRV